MATSDNEGVFNVDLVTRVIKPTGNAGKMVLIQGDHLSQNLTFYIKNREIDGKDVTGDTVTATVHFKNGKSKGYSVLTVSKEEGDGKTGAYFVWSVPSAATENPKDKLSFHIKLRETKTENEIESVTWEWNSDTYENIDIKPSYDFQSKLTSGQQLQIQAQLTELIKKEFQNMFAIENWTYVTADGQTVTKQVIVPKE